MKRRRAFVRRTVHRRDVLAGKTKYDDDDDDDDDESVRSVGRNVASVAIRYPE